MRDAVVQFLPLRLVEWGANTRVGRRGDAVGCFVALDDAYVLHSSVLEVDGVLTNGYFQPTSADPGFNGAGGALACEVVASDATDVSFFYYERASRLVFPLQLVNMSAFSLATCAALDDTLRASPALTDANRTRLCEADGQCRWRAGGCAPAYAAGDARFRRGLGWSDSATGFDATGTRCDRCWTFAPIREAACASCDGFLRLGSDASAWPLASQLTSLALPGSVCTPGDSARSYRFDTVDVAESPSECYAAQTRTTEGTTLLTTPIRRRCVTGASASCLAPLIGACDGCTHADASSKCAHNGERCVAEYDAVESCAFCDAIDWGDGRTSTLAAFLALPFCGSFACPTQCRHIGSAGCQLQLDAGFYDCGMATAIATGAGAGGRCAPPLVEECTCSAPPPPSPPVAPASCGAVDESFATQRCCRRPSAQCEALAAERVALGCC